MTSSKILKVWMGQEFYKLNGVGCKADYDVATLEFRINAWNIEKQHPQCWCRSCMQHYISCSILLWHRRATSENSICTRFFKKELYMSRDEAIEIFRHLNSSKTWQTAPYICRRKKGTKIEAAGGWLLRERKNWHGTERIGDVGPGADLVLMPPYS